MDVQEIFREAKYLRRFTFASSGRVCLLVTPDEWEALIEAEARLRYTLYPSYQTEEFTKFYINGIEIRKKYERPNFQPNDYLVMSGG